MRDNSYDRTIERNYQQKWRFLIAEYESVKAGRSEAFRTVGAFYRHHGTCSQTFRKYYNRYRQSGSPEDLLPRRRGPKWRDRREPQGIDAEILAQRRKGLNRYEILAVLKQLFAKPPSPSTIYRRLRQHGLNRKSRAMVEEKRKIIKTRLGEMGHVDLHQLPRDMFLMPPARPAYVISLLDGCSRLAWAEVVTSKKSVPVMFKTMRLLNALRVTYGIAFEEILTDNGAEFVGDPEEHPFELLIAEIGAKHRRTKPYRPQTNGKIERFWRTLNEDVIDEATFDNLHHFENELFDYLVYYNDHRPHQALGGATPKAFAEALPKHPPSAN
ncbi:MAG TPA: integrase core domain-containing protein [Methyloceanibacter sp.]|jgi:transposase InsO family protein|nr:integrase core domain-containing protein [Methyloceanibacter sp.]